MKKQIKNKNVNKKVVKKVIRNKVVNSVDKTINNDHKLNAKMERLQRTKDLILNAIDNFYSNRIDKIVRKIEFNQMQMKQAKEYTNKKLGSK